MEIIFHLERAQDVLLEDRAGLRTVLVVSCHSGAAGHPAHMGSHGSRTKSSAFAIC